MPYKNRLTVFRLGFALLAFVALPSMFVLGSQAHTASQANPELSTILTQLKSSQLQERMDAFDALLRFRAADEAKHPEDTDAINEALIQLLEKENANARQADLDFIEKLRTDPASAQHGADDPEGEFLGSAIQAAAALHDSRAIPVLLEDIETGNMATMAIAAVGEPILPALIRLLSATTPGSVVCEPASDDLCVQDLHFATMRTLSEMTSPPIYAKLPPSAQTEIRSILVKALQTEHNPSQVAALQGLRQLRDPTTEPALKNTALHDWNYLIRMGTVQALGDISDPALRPVLSGIAVHDTNAMVRKAAQKALQNFGGR